jgi:tRNA G26 N,N-dimethylase Trm1
LNLVVGVFLSREMMHGTVIDKLSACGVRSVRIESGISDDGTCDVAKLKKPARELIDLV